MEKGFPVFRFGKLVLVTYFAELRLERVRDSTSTGTNKTIKLGPLCACGLQAPAD